VRKLFDTLRLIRLANCLLTMVGVMVGARLTESVPAFYGPFMSALAAFFVCAAGSIINDLFDIKTDRINHPRRVLVRNLLTKRYAIILSAVFNTTAILIAWSVANAVFIAVISAILLLYFYNRHLKRVLLVGNIVIAFLGALTFLTGGLPVDISDAFKIPGPLIPAVFAILFHLIREIVKDTQDIEGDLLDSGRTLPQVIGVRGAMMVALMLGLILIILTLVPIWQGWFSNSYELVTVYLIDLPLLFALILLQRNPDKRYLRLSSSALKVEMAVGVVALLVA